MDATQHIQAQYKSAAMMQLLPFLFFIDGGVPAKKTQIYQYLREPFKMNE